jgi:hypothetical protein
VAEEFADRLPESNAEIVELASWVKDNRQEPDAHQLFVSYLIAHGFGRLRLRNVLMPVWKEAAESIEISGEDANRGIMLLLARTSRQGIINFLEGAATVGELPAASVPLLLEEWDALHFPAQLPEPVRERALKRHRHAIGEGP